MNNNAAGVLEGLVLYEDWKKAIKYFPLCMALRRGVREASQELNIVYGAYTAMGVIWCVGLSKEQSINGRSREEHSKGSSWRAFKCRR